MGRLLPLFPLQLVAFPGIAVPLHIFEARYREMVGEAEAAGSPFGIVLTRDGGVVNAGCTVVVESVPERYPDGSFDVITRGQRRFSLIALNDDKTYLRGEVDYFDDEDETRAPAELRRAALLAYREVAASQSTPADTQPDPRHPFFSFQLAHSIADLDFQNLILHSRSETARLEQFIDFAREYVPRSLYTAKMKQLAPRNGFGHKPVDA